MDQLLARPARLPAWLAGEHGSPLDQ